MLFFKALVLSNIKCSVADSFHLDMDPTYIEKISTFVLLFFLYPDPDPADQNETDPDPQHCNQMTCFFQVQSGTVKKLTVDVLKSWLRELAYRF